jgi:hypothetical protein
LNKLDENDVKPMCLQLSHFKFNTRHFHVKINHHSRKLNMRGGSGHVYMAININYHNQITKIFTRTTTLNIFITLIGYSLATDEF